MSETSNQTQLAPALRAAATHVADLVGGGCALVYAAVPGDDSSEATTRLRAAAGFAAADTAKNAASAALPLVRDAVTSSNVTVCAPLEAFGKRGAAETFVLPLRWADQVLGAIVVGAPRVSTESTAAALAAYAEFLSLRLDHAQVSARLTTAQSPPEEKTDDENEELLRLSEALFAQDIELLRSNEKLGKIEKLKNDFIEKMSRELRTPLNSIIESIIGVLVGENDHISDQAKSSLRTALDEGTAFQRTLQNILDLWQIKQNELSIEAQEVNVAEVVEEAIFSVQDSLGEKPVEILKDIDPSLQKVRTDLAKINQLLFLLLDNAVKFTEDGTVTIGARLVAPDRLECSVVDTGIGVCADDQEFIYDEFFQVDAHASLAYRGAGLGLSLVRDLILLMDGEMQFTSEAGRGTTVRFTLPIEAA
jgi:signal transduction histidine kinase